MTPVPMSFLRNRGEILLVRRNGGAEADSGRWVGIPQAATGDTDLGEPDARRQLRSATGLSDADLELVRSGRPLDVDADDSGTLFPFLFETETRAVTLGDAAAEWVDPTAIRRRHTAPWLWDAWRRVAPTVETVRTDRAHGAAWIAARALEVLRDTAVEAAGWDDVATTARALRTARPEMAAVANVVDEAVAAAGSPPVDPAAVVEASINALEATLAAGTDAASAAADVLAGADAVATLSRSGTVQSTIETLAPTEVVVAESRPACEGVGVAEWAAAETDATVTLTTEAGVPTALATHDVDAVLVGADSIHPDGSVVNKTGTRVLALAARDLDVPVYVVASSHKIRPAGRQPAANDTSEQTAPDEAVYDGDADLSVHAPTFEAVPIELVDGVLTEMGALDAAEIRAVAERHADNAAWADRLPE
jgi:translation initiation factor 2B subunit (eIF-2B alpha/beta/delta family)